MAELLIDLVGYGKRETRSLLTNWHYEEDIGLVVVISVPVLYIERL